MAKDFAKARGVTSGNAAGDGAPFRFWFVGDMERWAAKQSGVRKRPEFGHRQSSAVEMKWGVHQAGEEREAWAPCSEQTTMSLLVRGKFLLRFRSPGARGQVTEQRLEREGDYAIWGPDMEHTWVVEEEGVIFTVRWKESGNGKNSKSQISKSK